MRDYKFRGKRLDNGEWAYGDLVTLTSLDSPKGIRYFNDGSFWVEDVDPETVGEYTGLKDKNGTNEDIYEKDIMEFHAYGIHYIGVVEYHGSAFGIICRNTEVKASPFLDDAIDRHGAIKIGNIHDNPELIHDQKAEV